MRQSTSRHYMFSPLNTDDGITCNNSTHCNITDLHHSPSIGIIHLAGCERDFSLVQGVCVSVRDNSSFDLWSNDSQPFVLETYMQGRALSDLVGADNYTAVILSMTEGRISVNRQIQPIIDLYLGVPATVSQALHGSDFCCS